MKRSAVRWLGVLALLGMATACKSNPNVNVSNAPGITNTTSSVVKSIQVADATGSGGPFTIAKGQTLQLVPTGLDAANNTITGVSYVWSSSDPTVAAVSNNGLVTGVALGGPVTIGAANGTIKSNDVSVTVACAGIPSNAPTPMTVTLNPASPMTVRAITSVTAAIFDCNGSPVPDNTSVTFTLSDSTLGNLSSGSSLASTLTVPTAGGAGLASASFVAGTTAGSLTISATAGSITASAPVVIQALPVLGIQFLQANPQVVGIKGAGQAEVSEVSFSVTDTEGLPIGDGTVVNFQFLNGMNPGGGAAIDPPAAATVGGVAKTFLKSGFVAGPTRILAFIDANGNGTFDSGEIFSTSTPLSIGGGVPSARFFSVAADIHNLAGLAYDNEQANISAFMADRFGNFNVLQGTAVSFYTEAGAIDRQGVTDDKGETTVLFRTQNRLPVDTDPRQDLNPIGNETVLFNDLNSNGLYDLLEPNPRDGRVSVLAVTMGEETFYDTNGNGVYDPGEPFDDNGGEPFIDENDNGIYDGPEEFTDQNNNGSYDPGEPFYDKGRGEPFSDTNGNGVWDSGEPFTDINGNGVYDGPGDSYIDTNGNGVWDPGEPCKDAITNAPKGGTCNTDTTGTLTGFYNHVYDHGEFFVDFDGDGKWTPPNGKWDSNTAIWIDLQSTNQKVKKSTAMVFTGPVDGGTSGIVVDLAHQSGSGYSIPDNECGNFDIFVADVNNNPLIAGTTITVTVNGAGALTGPGTVTLGDSIGGGPTILSAQICDEDFANPDALKPSTLEVEVTWQPQGASTARVDKLSMSGLVAGK